MKINCQQIKTNADTKDEVNLLQAKKYVMTMKYFFLLVNINY